MTWNTKRDHSHALCFSLKPKQKLSWREKSKKITPVHSVSPSTLVLFALPHAWHDSFLFVTRIILVCEMIHFHLFTLLVLPRLVVERLGVRVTLNLRVPYVWHDSFLRVTYLIIFMWSCSSCLCYSYFQKCPRVTIKVRAWRVVNHGAACAHMYTNIFTHISKYIYHI
jgi:hypothetical protein